MCTELINLTVDAFTFGTDLQVPKPFCQGILWREEGREVHHRGDKTEVVGSRQTVCMGLDIFDVVVVTTSGKFDFPCFRVLCSFLVCVRMVKAPRDSLLTAVNRHDFDSSSFTYSGFHRKKQDMSGDTSHV